MPPIKERSIITDTLVVNKTGKPLSFWFERLDRKGAKSMTHLEIFTLVSQTSELKPLGQWNQNLLTTSYEWSRSLKARGQKEKDFEISVGKTMAVPVSKLYKSWAESRIRNKWLDEENISISKTTQNKSVRISWSDNQTRLSVDFYAKGENKSQVVVQHLKLKDSKKATQMKVYWWKKLDLLKAFLEK